MQKGKYLRKKRVDKVGGGESFFNQQEEEAVYIAPPLLGKIKIAAVFLLKEKLSLRKKDLLKKQKVFTAGMAGES